MIIILIFFLISVAFFYNILLFPVIFLQGVGGLLTSAFISRSIYINSNDFNSQRRAVNIHKWFLIRTIVRHLLMILLFLIVYSSYFITILHCEGIELVQWGIQDTICSHIKTKFTVAERAYWVMDNVPPYILGIVVGLTLGDGCLRIVKGGVNACLLFEQSTKYSPYFWYTITFGEGPIISTLPKFRVGCREGIPYYSLQFWTPCLPFLTKLHSVFYIDGIKRIPDCIFDLLTPIALAHWIICDGYRHGSGLIICTDSFTIPEVVQLMNVLMIRYCLNCTIHIHNNQPRIYIRKISMPLLRSIVMHYMIPSICYKLGAKQNNGVLSLSTTP